MTNPIPENIFYFELENKVTDVGLRLSIAKEVPDELEIRIDNLADNKVRVFLKGNKTAVERFYELLKTRKLGQAQHYRFSEVKTIDKTGCFGVSTDRFFHKLQCEQLGKFVEVGTCMQTNMESMDTSVKSMQTGIKSVKESIDKLTQTIEALPVALAEALKEGK
jgi:acylphosphatase